MYLIIYWNGGTGNFQNLVFRFSNVDVDVIIMQI